MFRTLTRAIIVIDTDRYRCVPPRFFQFTQGNSSFIDPSVLPPEIFEICTPTEGLREVIMAPPNKKWLALDVISTAGIATIGFSIDEHPMWVYAVDAHYIEPLKVDVLTVANGDRYSILVKLDKSGGEYGVRVASRAATQVIESTGILSYKARASDSTANRVYNRNDGANTPHGNSTDLISSKRCMNRVGKAVDANFTSFDQAMMKSFPPQFPIPAPHADQTFFMHMGTSENSYTWALNSTPVYHPALDDSAPLLWQRAKSINTNGNITIITNNSTWVDLIFITLQLRAPPHPIHKHSNKVFILGAGEGDFNWTSVEEAAAAVPQNFNLVTPPYRDGFVVPPSGLKPTWLAVRYHVINPGPFMLHCHIQSHLNGGMAMVMLDGIDAWPEVPERYMN